VKKEIIRIPRRLYKPRTKFRPTLVHQSAKQKKYREIEHIHLKEIRNAEEERLRETAELASLLDDYDRDYNV